MNGFIVHGDFCWNADSKTLQTIKDGWLVCVDGESRGVFTEIPAEYRNLPIKDYCGKLIFPGMIDLHIHAPQFAYRGLGMDLELLDWLNTHAFPEESKYSDLAYAEKAYGMFTDALRYSATTRLSVFATIHREATEMLMEMLESAGIYAMVGKVNMNRDCPDSLKESDSGGETRRWLDDIAGKFSRVKPIITPRFIPSCTDDLMVELGEIAKAYHLCAQSHLSENLGEIQLVASLQPDSPFYGKGYDRVGLFGGDVPTIMAHCVYSGDAEMKLMKENGVFIAHCPASNINVRSGAAPIRKYLEYGIKVGLGSDVAGGETESMFRSIVYAIQTSKTYWRLVSTDFLELTFPEAFGLATVGGGAFFGKVGSFDPGYEFDAIVLDESSLPHPQELTVQERAERAVYNSLDLRGIKAKFVGGKQII